MSAHGRRMWESILSRRYRHHGVRGVCLYCGVLADTLDHVPPLSIAEAEPNPDSMTPHWLVPACRECNSALNASPVVLLSMRRAILEGWYRRKYAKYLQMPDWTGDEFAEMGKNMRAKIRRGRAVKRAVLDRLAVLIRPLTEPEWIDYPETPEEDRYEAADEEDRGAVPPGPENRPTGRPGPLEAILEGTLNGRGGGYVA